MQIRCLIADGGTEGFVQVHDTNLVFPAEVSVKMKQYKDELLASCLTFVLSLPHDIIALDVRAYVPALQVGSSLVGVVVPEKRGSLGCTHMSEPLSPPPANIPLGRAFLRGLQCPFSPAYMVPTEERLVV